MTVHAYRIYQYRLPLRRRLRVGGQNLSHREGLLLCLEDVEGRQGWGEAAPLPGFSSESLAGAREALLRAAEAVLGREVIRADGDERPGASLPSVGFAVEQALSELWAAEQGRSPARYWSASPAPVLHLAALQTAEERDDPERWAALAHGGYRAVKIKVGRGDPQEEADLVRRLAETAGLALRLDANRAWDLPTALAFAGRLEDVPIAYLEEPLARPEDLPAFLERTALPVALDETLQALSPDDLERYRGVRAVVLKPTLLGGGHVLRRWVEAARAAGSQPVFSAAFEAGVGMRGLVALASALGDPDLPAGLDTYRALAADVLAPRLPVERPVVDVEALLEQPVHLVEDRLTLLAAGTHDGYDSASRRRNGGVSGA